MDEVCNTYGNCEPLAFNLAQAFYSYVETRFLTIYYECFNFSIFKL